MMAANAYALSEHFIDYAGRPPRRLPDPDVHGLDAGYRLYPAADGWVFLAVHDDDAFARLSEAVGEPGLAKDPRFATSDARASHDAELADTLASVFTRETAERWERDLLEARVACVRVHDGTHAAYVFDAPWAERLGFVEQSAAIGTGPYPRYGHVVRAGRDVGALGAADAVGAQTRAILTELGYADGEVESLITRGIVGVPG